MDIVEKIKEEIRCIKEKYNIDGRDLGFGSCMGPDIMRCMHVDIKHSVELALSDFVMEKYAFEPLGDCTIEKIKCDIDNVVMHFRTEGERFFEYYKAIVDFEGTIRIWFVPVRPTSKINARWSDLSPTVLERRWIERCERAVEKLEDVIVRMDEAIEQWMSQGDDDGSVSG
jgi:hypothetical protein